MMKSRMLFFGLLLGVCLPSAQAQDIDVTQLLADTKTFIFSNNKNTVKGYIYAELEEKTSCCGSDRIYLEVRIDPSGYVTQAKTLTGKNECMKQAAIDIVKNVKWDAKDFKREKSVYFEIKPEIDCKAGERTNNYAQVEIFNNELLDKEGNRTGVSLATSEPEETAPKPQMASAGITTPPASVAKTPEPVKPAVTAPATTTPTPAATKPAATKPAATTPAATTPAATTPAATTQPIASSQGTSRSNSTAPAVTAAAPAPGGVELESNVKDEEIRILKEQMEAARAKEEAARQREKQLKEEQARRERENAEREKAREQKAKESFAGAQGEGGLFFDEGSSKADQGGDGRTQGGDPAASAEQRAQDDIRRLEQQLREIEERNRLRDNELRARERDDQLAAQEMIRIREEILRKQEEMERNREQQELDRIGQDRRRAEEEQRKYEEEVRRMMDEIARLQAESERKMQELQRQKQEMDRLAQMQIQREQEQMLQRQLREKQREAEMAAMRMSAQGSRNIASSAPAVTTSTLPPNFTIPSSDSAKLDLILMQMSILQQELMRVQAEMANLRGGGGIAPINSPTSTPRGLTTPTRTATPASGGAKNAGQDDRWKNIDNGVPGGSRGGASVVDPGRFDPVRGYSPAMSHADSHENVGITRFPPPTSDQGQGNMKNYINEELRKRGVCGLAQAFAEITISPQGDVTRYNVIKANDLTVSSALPGILQGMKFEPTELDVPYVSYIEFKAEILCEGQDRINIREVGDYINERP